MQISQRIFQNTIKFEKKLTFSKFVLQDPPNLPVNY